MPEYIGHLFPLGGPVPTDAMIGRAGERANLENRLRAGMSTMVVGPRRAGKTTVCQAACETLVAEGALCFDVEVPERDDAESLLRLVVDRAAALSVADEARGVARAVRPVLDKVLRDHGVPLELAELGSQPRPADLRAILSLPVRLARQRRRRLVRFLDELQRVVPYHDGERVLRDLIDIYTGQRDVVVLVDGSEERTLDGMLGAPLHFGKLVDRQSLSPEIPLTTWREPLTERFRRAGLELPEAQRERLLGWSRGHVYPTMAASRFTAFAAQRTGTAVVADFDVDMGLDEARGHLGDDGA
jgi:hypothetical protein